MMTKVKLTSLFSFLALVLFFSSCKVHQPELKSVRNVSMGTKNDGKVFVYGDAELYNPNKFSMEIREIHVDVFVNGDSVGSVDQMLEQTMPAQGDFSLPLEVAFPPGQIFSSMLTGIFGAATGKPFEIKYRGYIRTKAAGVPLKVPIISKSKIKFTK
ncbi:LEA type 2 family protein [Algivirga pacifica]|uniref:Late embryogenesis abundant protein LEA-2 subgroup domain-containing protein n=1 Tax=Algivirga pacifica TaxID=1162670 RepID=A0ABP9DCU9_9BACT